MELVTELDERKRKILKAIIQTYLETGEPVGSRTISKYTDLNLSSATIRNEMSDLEELGYIVQPYTSAGRIPSDLGYRLYVDELMKEKEQEVAEIKELMIEKTDKMEKVLKQVVKVLASNTNYATMITGPSYHRNKLKFIQLSKVGEMQLLAVVVVEGNLVKNHLIDLNEPMDDETVLKLNLLLNTQLNGLSIEEINLAMISRLKEQAGVYSGVIGSVIDAVAQAIAVDEEEMEIYTSGATNIFKYPELADKSRASELISAFEEKQTLAEFVKDTMDTAEGEQNTGIQVYIGNESPVQTMKDCSVVTATYDLGGGMQGTIGIIGPKRMDYENVVDNLKTLKNQLDHIFKKELERRYEIVAEEKNVYDTMEEEKTSNSQAEDNVNAAEETTEETVEAVEGTVEEAQEAEDATASEKKGLFGKKKKDKKDEKIEELTDMVKRQMAEFDNYRKRTEKEKASMYQIGAKEIVEKILPVVDNFERGIAAIPEEEAANPFAEGMTMIYKQLMSVFDDMGVKAIEAVGQEFNPDFHNAVMHVEDEEAGENVVVEEFQKGYMYKDSVIRHSMVKVAN